MPLISDLVQAVQGGGLPTVSLLTMYARIRKKWLNDEPWEDTLSSDQDASATTINLTNASKWNPSDVIDTYLELERIIPASTPLANPITVKRGHDSTNPYGHVTGDVVLKNPRFRSSTIVLEIENIANDDVYPYLWTVSTVDITPSTTTAIYPITDLNFRKVIAVVQQSLGTVTDVARLPPPKIEYVRSSLSSTNRAFRFRWFDNMTNPVTVIYKARISASATSSNIPDGPVADCILMGAAARVLKAKAIELSNRDTGARDQKAQVSELVGESNDLKRDYELARARAVTELTNQWQDEPDWVGFESAVSGW